MYFSLKFQVTAHHCRADRGGIQTIESTVRGKGRLSGPLLVCCLAMHSTSFLYSDNRGPHVKMVSPTLRVSLLKPANNQKSSGSYCFSSEFYQTFQEKLEQQSSNYSTK